MSKIIFFTVVVFVLFAGERLQAGFEPIIETSGQAQWKAGPNTPEAVRVSEGIKFPCQFTAQDARFYWDCSVSVDLTKSATIELELSCPNSEAVQSVGLYLKSGKGWYLWIKPIVKSGRQKFFLQIKDVATEGHPAGWNKITGVRISFQNNLAANTYITLQRLAAGNSGIILVNGTSSAPDNGERKIAEKTTSRLSKWLEDIGVAHSVLDDEDIAGGRVRSAAVIILPYNPHLSDREMRQLAKLSANGSKLIVFYGTDPRLAELLGMRLGKYQAAGEPGHWSFFIFNRAAPAGIPPKIIQESGNIFTVFPDSENSKIIANWQDADGKTLSDPAWVQSDKGVWMTHILLGEDSENKKKMLLALLGQYEKGVWKEATQNANGQAKHINGADGATNQRIKTDEFRGVWNHSGMGLYPGDWNKTCKLLAASGITAVFPNMLWPGVAHYPSKYVRQSEQSKPFGDQAAQCVAATRSTGLELHVWKVCWSLGWTPKEFIENMRKQGRLQKNSKNETINWLCPSDPANIALELNTIIEAVIRYDIDGVHLDYIRYPDDKTCFCAGCRQRYENWSGQTVKSWPKDVSSGGLSGNYKTWRSSQITEFVRTVRREMKKVKPQVKFSAAVYPKYPECIESIGQDWGLWLKEGIVDFVCPMDYLPTVSSFREILYRQMALQNGNKRIYPGIGATLSEGDLGSEIFLGQIRALRERGAGGFVLFDLNPSLAANFLPLVREGDR